MSKRQLLNQLTHGLEKCGFLKSRQIGTQFDYDTHFSFSDSFDRLELRIVLQDAIKAIDLQVKNEYQEWRNSQTNDPKQ